MCLEKKLVLGGLAFIAFWLFVVLPIAHSIDLSKLSWTEVATAAPILAAVAAAISAIASAFSARANHYNTKTFQRQLRNSTIDACIGAAVDLRGAINRAIRLKVETGGTTTAKVWEAYTEAWSERRAFEKAFAVARRYSAGFHSKKPEDELARLLEELRIEFQSAKWTAADDRAASFQQRAKAILDDVISTLQSTPVARASMNKDA